MTHAQRIIKVAAVQMAPVLNDAMGTLHKVLKAIDDAAALGVQLIVFPETFVPYYPYFSFIRPPVATGAEHMALYAHAVVVPGPVTEAVSQRARQHGMVVVLGVNERDHGTSTTPSSSLMRRAPCASSAASSRPPSMSAWCGGRAMAAA
jgi:nitrilase